MLIPADITFPKMALAAQHFTAPYLVDVPGAIRAEMARLGVAARVRPGMRVAVTAGSRGITGIPTILATVVSELKRMGAVPFVIPCMGSHGGATAEGQMSVLNSLGVTEEAVGCPIYSSMDTVQIGRTAEGTPVFIDALAASADGIAVVNRIKPHTGFVGPIGSGLMKMLTIGLGKHQGALMAHRNVIQMSYPVAIVTVAREIVRKAPLLFGLGVIENAFDQTVEVVAAWPQGFEETDKAGVVRARALMPRIPFRQMDILIVDELGKEISGAGIDPNVIGRGIAHDGADDLFPAITRIVARDLSAKTYGNAIGMGFADYVTQRLVDKLDRRPTYINAITSVDPDSSRIPITGQTDREAIEWAFLTIGAVDSDKARVVRIQNTLHLECFYVSEALLPEIEANPALELVGEWAPMSFDQAGALQPDRVNMPA